MRLLPQRMPSKVGETVTTQSLSVIAQTDGYTVMGVSGQVYAIIPNDDRLPEVIGYATGTFSTANPAFNWYLENAEAVCTQVAGGSQPARIVKPDPTKYPTSISALVPSKWGQQSPYNRYTPNNYPTGCVATAMAQIMYYHKLPVKGTGSRTITFPYDDPSGRKLTADFGNTTYDWANMRDIYTTGSYTSTEANAVALIMYHCGIAVNMDYKASASGAYTVDAASGLRKYFGFPSTVRVATRGSYSEAEWMDLIYSNVSHNMPILYTGVDSRMGGHAFVLDGYDADGLVHINWGWNGDDDGYYNVALLNPQQYSFVEDQDMVIGIRGGAVETVERTVTTTKAGELASLLGDDAATVTSLHVNGPINSTDLKFIRQLAGKDSLGHTTTGILSSIDLTDAIVEAGGEPYLIDGNRRYVTTDATIPTLAFYGCEPLTFVALPTSVTEIGNGAFGMCVNLDSVSIANATGHAYYYEDGLLFGSSAKTVLKECMPFVSGKVDLDDGLTDIEPYAFAGCVQIKSVSLPTSVIKIGKETFQYCYSMTDIHSFNRNAPDAGVDAFDGVDRSTCKLYVPSGSKTRYAASSEWKDFIGSKVSNGNVYSYDNIVEFGVTITARNSTKRYGDKNPRFGYKIEGNAPSGTPSLYCEADEKSPVGEYRIVISRGTITDSTVQFRNGVLRVRQAKLEAHGDTIEVVRGKPIPTLTISYNGFKNGEDESVLAEKPVASTVATSNSPVGDYEITVMGGTALNYEISCSPGLLRIKDVPNGIDQTVMTSDSNTEKELDEKTYNLSGQRIGKQQKGIVIIGNKKIIRK